MLALADAGEHGVLSPRLELVPAHMRDLERGVGGLYRHDLAANPAEARHILELAAPARRQLHAHADPEKRPAARDHAFVERRLHAADCREAAPTIGEGAHAGQHHAIGLADEIGIAGHHHVGGEAALTRGALDGLRGGAQIS